MLIPMALLVDAIPQILFRRSIAAKENVFIFEDDIEFLPYDNLNEIIDQCCEELEILIESDIFWQFTQTCFSKSNRL